MRAMAVRSIPLSSATRHAWKSAGVSFARRDRTDADIMRITPPGIPILNLGSSTFALDHDAVWNIAENVKPLLTPAGTREKFSPFLPPGTWQGDGFYWEKYSGRAGRNKQRLYLSNEWIHDSTRHTAQHGQGDLQLEVEGQEYRAITVGDKVVQVNARYGSNGAREYRWVGVRNAPAPIKSTAKACASLLEGNNVIAWDLIMTEDERVYMFEGNSCPGINDATAQRIVAAMLGENYA